MAADDDKDLRELNEQFGIRFNPGQAEGVESGEVVDELAERRARADIQEKEVRIVGVFQAPQTGGAFVLLRDNQGRNLPIWIDDTQAVSISLAVGDANITSRPMTHDLVKQLIERLGGGIESILIDDLYGNVYYAKLMLVHGESRSEIDCRPSDAIALAARFHVPIHVADRVLEEGQWPISEAE